MKLLLVKLPAFWTLLNPANTGDPDLCCAFIRSGEKPGFGRVRSFILWLKPIPPGEAGDGAVPGPVCVLVLIWLSRFVLPKNCNNVKQCALKGIEFNAVKKLMALNSLFWVKFAKFEYVMHV